MSKHSMRRDALGQAEGVLRELRARARLGWALTALAAAWSGVVVGAVAPAGSARRDTAWVAVVPAVPIAALVIAVAQPRSLPRVASLTTISVGFGALMGVTTGVLVQSSSFVDAC